MSPGDPGPTFLVVGAARSGTTLLMQLLGSHPDVFVSDPKEPHFLALGDQAVAFTGPGDAETVNRVTRVTESSWRALFEDGRDAVARGEGSVSTLYYADRATERIDRFCPEAHLIVVLREPVARAFSAYGYLVGKGYEEESFERALDLEPSRIRSGWHHLWHYARMGDYLPQLSTFAPWLDSGRLLVLDFDDLVRDPVAVTDRCFDFIGVDPWAVTAPAVAVNAGGSPRSVAVERVVRWARSHEAVRHRVRSMLPSAARERLRSYNLTEMQAPEEACQLLEDRYGPDRSRLAALLGDQSPAWAVT